MPMMFAKRAIEVAASSAAMSVELPRLIMTSVKSISLSVWIPRRLAEVTTAAMSVVDAASLVDMLLMSEDSCANSSLVAVVTFWTSANADSNSMLALTAVVPSATMGVVTVAVSVLPTFSADLPIFSQRSPNSVSALPAAVHADCAVRSWALVSRIAASVSRTAACARFSCVCAVDTASAAFCVLRRRASFCPASCSTSAVASAYSCCAASMFCRAAIVAESVSPRVSR